GAGTPDQVGADGDAVAAAGPVAALAPRLPLRAAEHGDVRHLPLRAGHLVAAARLPGRLADAARVDRARQLPGAARRPRLPQGAAQHRALRGGHRPGQPARRAGAGRADEAARGAVADLLPGRLLPAGGDLGGDPGHGLALDVQPAVRGDQPAARPRTRPLAGAPEPGAVGGDPLGGADDPRRRRGDVLGGDGLDPRRPLRGGRARGGRPGPPVVGHHRPAAQADHALPGGDVHDLGVRGLRAGLHHDRRRPGLRHHHHRPVDLRHRLPRLAVRRRVGPGGRPLRAGRARGGGPVPLAAVRRPVL
ncbi:MAG: N-Acetyl-D-glucosamine ABC transport system, permease protein 1, partial [uncultured Thermomicrobiales bacterium]